MNEEDKNPIVETMHYRIPNLDTVLKNGFSEIFDKLFEVKIGLTLSEASKICDETS